MWTRTIIILFLSFSNLEEVRDIVGSPKEVEAAMNFLHNNSQ